MSNFASLPVNQRYLYPFDTFWSSPTNHKRLETNSTQREINIEGQCFTVDDIQSILKDVQNNTFNGLLANAVRYMEEQAPLELVNQARPYLYALNDITSAYETFGFPPLAVSFPEDQEMLLEWNFDHFAIGLSFDEDPEKSSWYTVNDGTVKKTTAWGYLNTHTINELMRIITGQVLESYSAN